LLENPRTQTRVLPDGATRSRRGLHFSCQEFPQGMAVNVGRRLPDRAAGWLIKGQQFAQTQCKCGDFDENAE
jgi:hypothetical protein